MKNLFHYLNFPKIPENLELMSLANIDDVYLEKYKEINEKEVYGTMIARVPNKVYEWIEENILIHLNSNNPYFKKILIHKHHYIEYTGISWGYQYHEARGIVPMHKDYGRCYAINYVIDQGGKNVLTKWWDDEYNLLEKHCIEKGRWCILSTKVLHSVENIEKNKSRIIIGLNWDPIDNNCYDQIAQYIS